MTSDEWEEGQQARMRELEASLTGVSGAWSALRAAEDRVTRAYAELQKWLWVKPKDGDE